MPAKNRPNGQAHSIPCLMPPTRLLAWGALDVSGHQSSLLTKPARRSDLAASE